MDRRSQFSTALRSSRFILFSLIVLALTLASIPNVIVYAVEGDPDKTFGAGDIANAVAPLADGKTVTAATLTRSAFALARYTTDWRLDSSLWSSGKVHGQSTATDSDSKPTQTQGRASRDFEPEDGPEMVKQRLQLYRLRHGDADPQQRLELARKEYQRRLREEVRRQLLQADLAEPIWTALGPTNGAGRMTSIAPHPTITGTVYVGADGGGVWKTTDAGSTWIPLTDSINSLEVGALAVAASNPNIIYLGSGTTPLVNPQPVFRGIGLLKSTDGGSTWSFPATVIATRFFKISVHPTNPNDLLIATNQGGFRSTNGGQNWTEVIPRLPGDFALEVNDIARDPGSPQILYATTYSHGIYPPKVFKSPDGGASWTEKYSGLTASEQIAISISVTNPQILYASSTTNEPNDMLSRIYKTTNGGDSWVELTGVSANPNFNISHFLDGAVWRHNTIVVSPTNENIVLAGGVTYVRSTDGGNTWQVPQFFNAPVHVDATDMRYQGSTLYITNDGGIWSTNDNGDTTTDRNATLATRQYYVLTSDPILQGRIYAGSQDNGTDRRPDSEGTSWTGILGGDGFDSAVNRDNPSTAYATLQNGVIVRTRDAANPFPGFFSVTPPYTVAEAVAAPFFTRVTMDPNNPSVLYTANTRIWRTTNEGDSWAPLPTTTDDGSFWDPGSFFLNSIAVARSNSAIVMISRGSSVLRSTNGGTSWTTKLISALGEVANVEIDPANPNIVYVATPGWDNVQFTGKIYATTNGGASWTQRGTGLPLAAIQAVCVDPIDSNLLYCGTDIGVYRSTDQGFTWSRFGVGLPSAAVHDVRVTGDGTTLRVATYGRGVWDLSIRSTPGAGINGSVTSPSGIGISNVLLTLSLNGNQVITKPTDANGLGSFGHLAAGLTYTVTPFKSGYVFSPASRTFANLNSVQVATFTGVPVTAISSGLSGFLTDLDGDGKSDIGFYRSGLWGWLESSESYNFGSPRFFSWGGASLQPISSDFDGDGKADIGYMAPPSGGQSAAYAILLSSRNYSFDSGQPLFVPAGFPSIGDTPVAGDTDGDGKDDPGIWRASQGVWIIPQSSSNYTSYLFAQWGQLGDVPLIADFDADGKVDLGFYRDGLWGVLQSSHAYSTTSPLFFSWGGSGLQPIVADFDGDGKADIGYMAPPAGGQSAAYAILLSTRNYSFAEGQPLFIPAGFPSLGDTPVVGDFDGDGKADAGIWRESQGVWIIALSSGSYASYIFSQWGQPADIAFPNSIGRH